MTSESIGFIGLGNMGGRMSKCIVRNGQSVLGFDTNTEMIVSADAQNAGSVAGVVKSCDIVLLSLPDSKVVEAVVLGDDGVLANARAGQIIVDLSTAAPESTRKIYNLLKTKGASYLDAGISGGAAAADAGTLTLMVGGEEEILVKVLL